MEELTCTHYTRQEKPARDKHSSLFGHKDSDKEKSFTTLVPGVNVISFFFVTDEKANRLVCLSLASLYS